MEDNLTLLIFASVMILFRPSQINVKSSKGYGKWYARMWSANTINTADLARELSHSSSITEADILAVLYGMEDIIRQHLNNSETVRLDRLGTFRVSLCSHLADSKDAVNKNLIYGYRVVFLPEKSFSSIKGVEGRRGFFTTRLIRGVDSKALRQPKK